MSRRLGEQCVGVGAHTRLAVVAHAHAQLGGHTKPMFLQCVSRRLGEQSRIGNIPNTKEITKHKGAGREIKISISIYIYIYIYLKPFWLKLRSQNL